MLDVLRIEMQACERAANRYRSWRVEVGQDLFGMWTVRVTFGRIGCNGRTVSRLFPTEAAAKAFARSGLRRRQTSMRRFGVPYRLVEASPAATALLELTGIIAAPAVVLSLEEARSSPWAG